MVLGGKSAQQSLNLKKKKKKKKIFKRGVLSNKKRGEKKHAVTPQALLTTPYFSFLLVNELQIYRDVTPPGDGCSRFIDAYIKPG